MVGIEDHLPEGHLIPGPVAALGAWVLGVQCSKHRHPRTALLALKEPTGAQGLLRNSVKCDAAPYPIAEWLPSNISNSSNGRD